MQTEKKVVDLIYIPPQKSEKELVQEFKRKIDFWLARLKELQEQYFEQNYDSASDDVKEVMGMRRFLSKFLTTRIEWIENNVNDPAKRLKYLNVLPPFPQKGGIKTLLMHFFQVVDTEDKKSIKFKPVPELEREVRVLWDIYKLRKTIESIEVLQKSLVSDDPFPSEYSVEERKECLSSLKTVFKMMFQVCLQPQYRKELYQDISPKHIKPEEILNRKQSGKYYVYDHVIEKFDYRNHFFFIYYYSGMKAKIGGQIKEYRFNYLDFELIKQDFLVDWLNRRLADNPNKLKIYQNYSMNGKTLDKIVQENPSKEIEILKQLPINIFNDITAEINQTVGKEEQTQVESFSENHGEFAESQKQFKLATKLAKRSIDKIKEFVSKIKEESPASIPDEPQAPEPEPVKEPEPPPKPTFEVIRVKKNEIDFPYFQKSQESFPQKLSLFRIKSNKEKFIQLTKKLTKLLSSISETSLITRRTPKHEWVMPFIVKENIGPVTTEHFLILGAEVKSKQLGMGYSSKSTSSAYSFQCYLVYGKSQKDGIMGEPVETRHIKGREFFEFDFTNPVAQDKAYDLFEVVMEKL